MTCCPLKILKQHRLETITESPNGAVLELAWLNLQMLPIFQMDIMRMKER